MIRAGRHHLRHGQGQRTPVGEIVEQLRYEQQGVSRNVAWLILQHRAGYTFGGAR